jgi:hypothetical protein
MLKRGGKAVFFATTGQKNAVWTREYLIAGSRAWHRTKKAQSMLIAPSST